MPSKKERIAAILYDELTGRHTAQDPANAVLGRIRDDQPEVRILMIHAANLGYEVIHPVGDRWALAQSLAAQIMNRTHPERRNHPREFCVLCLSGEHGAHQRQKALRPWRG